MQTSCGYAVPSYDHVAERGTLRRWAAPRDEAALQACRAEKNALTLDGFPTGTPK